MGDIGKFIRIYRGYYNETESKYFVFPDIQYQRIIADANTSSPLHPKSTRVIESEGMMQVLESYHLESDLFFNQDDASTVELLAGSVALNNITAYQMVEYILLEAGLELGTDLEDMTGEYIYTEKPKFTFLAEDGWNGQKMITFIMKFYLFNLLFRNDKACMFVAKNSNGNAAVRYDIPTDGTHISAQQGYANDGLADVLRCDVYSWDGNYEGSYQDGDWVRTYGKLIWTDPGAAGDTNMVVTSNNMADHIAETQVYRYMQKVSYGERSLPSIDVCLELFSDTSVYDDRNSLTDSYNVLVGGFAWHYRAGQKNNPLRTNYYMRYRIGGVGYIQAKGGGIGNSMGGTGGSGVSPTGGFGDDEDGDNIIIGGGGGGDTTLPDPIIDTKVVKADSVITDNTLVRGDGGARKVQDTGVTIDDNDIMAALKGIHFAAETELTISSGAITVTQTRHTVDTESDAASDNLETINGNGTVNFVLLRAENSAHVVTIKHNTGNIWLQGQKDQPLNQSSAAVLLAWDADNSKWFDIAFGNVSATADITDNALVKGYGGKRFVQPTGISVDNSNNVVIPDDSFIQFGGAAQLGYETADANANALILSFPEGGATDVPAFIMGDSGILNADLGVFNGLTEPSLVIYNDAADAYVRLDAGDDSVAGSKGLYFKPATDEDVEIINIGVTGTPRVYWDETYNVIHSTVGFKFDSTFTLIDGQSVALGNSNDVRVTYSTTDADAKCLIFTIDESDDSGNNVPAFVFGEETNVWNTDLGFFDGIVQPVVAVINLAGDAYVTLDAGDDSDATAKGLYFKPAADEDVEIINVGVTGTPQIYWDESLNVFHSTVGFRFDSTFTLADSQSVALGNTNDVRITYSTSDADAKCLIFTIDESDDAGNNVPAFLFGEETNVFNANLGLFDAVTEPIVAVIDLDGDSYFGISFASDDTPQLRCGGVATQIQVRGFTPITENHTADDTLTVGESGSIHTNYGEDGVMSLTLPASAPIGTTFKFVVAYADELRVVISAAAGSFIVNGGTSTDDGGADLYVSADDEGEMMTVTCIGTDIWLCNVIGTWTVTQP